MIETQLNLFDAGVIAILFLSTLAAFFRGLVKEILSLGAWVGAGLVTIYFFPAIAAKLAPHTKNQVVAAGFATLGIYVAALVVISLFNMLLLRFIKPGSDVGMLDNLLGMLFGATRGAFIVSLGFLLMTMVTAGEDEYPEWVAKARTHKLAEYGAVLLGRAAPDYIKDITTLRAKIEGQEGVNFNTALKATKGEKEDSPFRLFHNSHANKEEKEKEGGGKGYSRESREEMHRVIDDNAYVPAR